MAFVTVPGVSDGELIRTLWGDTVADNINTELIRRNGAVAMTGLLTLHSATPTADNHAVRKKYVDDKFLMSTGDTMTGQLILNPAATTQCLILRSQDTGVGGSFQDTPYLSFHDHTQAIQFAYIQGTSANLNITHNAGDIVLNSGGGQVRIVDPIYATGASRFFASDEQVQLVGTGSRAILSWYSDGASVDSRGVRSGFAGYPDSSHLVIANEISAGSMILSTTGASALLFSPGGTERARVESDGQFFVGKSDPADTVEGIMMASGGTMHICRGEAGGAVPLTVNYQASVDGNHFIDFSRSGTVIGRVEQNGTTGVSYVTSSDRRMKTIVGPIDDAVDRVKALNPVRVTWNGDPARGETDAFIADEVQSVVPAAVSGQPDAVDEDGAPAMQGVDYSALVTVTVAALQEALTKIDELTARIDALEAA